MVPRSIRAAHSTDGASTKLPTTSINRDDPEGVVSIPLEDTSTNAPAEKNVEGATIQGDHEQGSDEKDIIPNGGYGWVNVGCVVVQNSVTWGVNTTYGVYSAYYLQNNHFEGGSTFKYAWVGGLCVAVALLIAPGVNVLVRKFGFRIPLIIGLICISLGQCLAGICTTFAGFIVCQGLVFGLGLGCCMIPIQPLLAQWFDRKLSFAVGIGAAGSGLGGLVLSNVTRVTLERYGVKWSLIINGLISLVCLVPTIILFKSRHKQVGSRVASFQLKWIVHPGYVWVLLWGFFSLLMYFIALYSLASFATYGLGLSQTQGAALQSILSAAQMLGRPAWGITLDYGGRINMTSLCYIISGLSCLIIWLPAKSFGVLILFALVQGFTGGTVWSAATPLTARIVGVKDVASALSIFWVICVPSALVGQPIAVALLEYSERMGKSGAEAYYIPIGVCGGMGVLSGLCLLGAKRYQQGTWKVLQIT